MPYPRPTALAGALTLALAGLSAVALPLPAGAQIRRCTTPDGGTVYTDRSCDAMGAVETRPAAGMLPGSGPRYRGGCARRLQDLVFEVTAAIDARDTNRLARSYHWTGLSTRSGYAVLERLDAIAQRPLLNVTALRPATPAPVPAPAPAMPPLPTPEAAGRPPASAPATATIVPPASPSPLRPAASRRPVALRIDQSLADGITPSSTTFGLRRHMDCWWITL